MLVVEDLQVELAGKTILRHIDLEIKPGETHVLFGPNGSGKTSLLMTIMGYPQYKVVGGKITFKGVDITRRSHQRTGTVGHWDILPTTTDHPWAQDAPDGADLCAPGGGCGKPGPQG